MESTETVNSCDECNKSPKVSVIIPCYNEPENVFRRSIDSVIHQTLEDIEIIIVLDNPNNRKLQWIILEYSLKFSNILFFNPWKNLWRWEARNFWTAWSHGKYIAIHDADDIDIPERLERQYHKMEEDPLAGAMIAQVEHVDTKWNQTANQPKWIPEWENSFFRMPFNHPTLFIKREVFDRLEWYQDMNFWEDVDLWMRLYLDWQKLLYDNEVLTQYLAPNQSQHSEYFAKMKQWNSAKINRYFTYFFHPKVMWGIHFHRMWLRSILDKIALGLWEKFYRNYTSFVKKIMCFIRMRSKRKYK